MQTEHTVAWLHYVASHRGIVQVIETSEDAQIGYPRQRVDLTDVALVASQPPICEVVKQYIQDQILDGTFPVGSPLPSVRQLSSQMGINRNTVSKAYQALGREGIVVSRRGAGVVVVRRPVDDRLPDNRLSSAIRALAREARLLGLSKDSVIERVATEMNRLLETPEAKVAFIECSPPDTEAMSRHLSHHLGVPVAPLDLNEFLEDPGGYAEQFTILTTTFFHLQEIMGVLDGHQIDVVGLHHIPSHKSILDLARLSQGTTIGLVCSNERTLRRVETVVRTYTHGELIACTIDDEACLARVAREADVIVDHVQSHRVASEYAHGLPIIKIEFQSEPQSIDYLQSRVKKALSAAPLDHLAET